MGSRHYRRKKVGALSLELLRNPIVLVPTAALAVTSVGGVVDPSAPMPVLTGETLAQPEEYPGVQVVADKPLGELTVDDLKAMLNPGTIPKALVYNVRIKMLLRQIRGLEAAIEGDHFVLRSGGNEVERMEITTTDPSVEEADDANHQGLKIKLGEGEIWITDKGKVTTK